MSDKKYRIRNNRWQNACMEGFEILPDDAVRVHIEEEADGSRTITLD